MGDSPLGGGGKGGSSSSGSSDPLSGLAGAELSQAGGQNNLAGLDTGYGINTVGPGYNQFLAGATGQLTPAQQAQVQEALSQMNLSTTSNYSNLGLPGSTMETQDLNANQESTLANEAALNQQSEQEGLAAMGEGLSFLNAGGTNLSGAGSSIGNAANIVGGQQANQNSSLSSLASGLGGKAGGGSGSTSTAGGTGSLGNILSLFGGGSSSAGAVDTGTWDTTAASDLVDSGAWD